MDNTEKLERFEVVNEELLSNSGDAIEIHSFEVRSTPIPTYVEPEEAESTPNE